MRQTKNAFAGFALCLLAACGGGSSGGGATVNPPPTPPPVATVTRTEAFRLLNQASFGATDFAAQQVTTQGLVAWIDAQIAAPASLQLPSVQAAYAALPTPVMNIGQLHDDRVGAWFTNSVRGPDQLRQRVAFALSRSWWCRRFH